MISGAQNILAMRADLIALAERYGQPGMMQSLEYFLALPYFGLQVPFKVVDSSRILTHLITRRRKKLPRLLLRSGRHGLDAAVLLCEHQLHGFHTGLYMPTNGDGYRTVLAPAEEVDGVAREAGEFALKQGAILVLISYLDPCNAPAAEGPAAGFQDGSHLIATQLRDASRNLPLAPSFDGTLALMGRHTRRNLRASQRRVIQELGAVYTADAQVSLSDFLELNRASMYSAPDWAARWRYESVRNVAHGSMAGLRAADGAWLSLIGGHRHEDTVWLDWQMNLTRFASFSLVSAMRAFFIASQIDQGARWIRFEGGTSHSISAAFVKEQARDLIFARGALSPRLVRALAKGISTGGPIAKALSSPSLVWRS